MDNKKGMKTVTKKQLLEMLGSFDDNMEIGFYLEGIGDFLLEGVYPAKNLETNEDAITFEFAWR